MEEREKVLEDREKHLNQKEINLQEREKHLDGKERHLLEREKHLDRRETRLEEREKRLDDRDVRVDEREERLETRERYTHMKEHHWYGGSEWEWVYGSRQDSLQRRERALQEKERELERRLAQLKLTESGLTGKPLQTERKVPGYVFYPEGKSSELSEYILKGRRRSIDEPPKMGEEKTPHPEKPAGAETETSAQS